VIRNAPAIHQVGILHLPDAGDVRDQVNRPIMRLVIVVVLLRAGRNAGQGQRCRQYQGGLKTDAVRKSHFV